MKKGKNLRNKSNKKTSKKEVKEAPIEPVPFQYYEKSEVNETLKLPNWFFSDVDMGESASKDEIEESINKEETRRSDDEIDPNSTSGLYKRAMESLQSTAHSRGGTIGIDNPITEESLGLKAEPQKKREYPYIRYNPSHRNSSFVTKTGTLRFLSKPFFSCGIGMFGDIESVYRHFGICAVKSILSEVQNNFNTTLRESQGDRFIFGLFSITDRYEELVNYFYKIASTASDFEQNFNSENRIIIFTLKLK